VIRTFYLSNVSSPTEMQDLVNAMRNILEVSRIQPIPSKEAIVVRGTPDQILLAGKLVHDFDTAQPEVIIELAIMQVSRDKMHNLGISPPTSASVQLQNNSSSSSSSSANTINLNRLGNLNATDFTATISSASATALLNDSATKIIQNPQLRSVDGQKASLRIGDRVPTATGSYQSGVTGGSVNPLVGTQFQYLDVGVNLDVTPHIHPDGDISLKIALEVSSVTNYVTIASISEPVIGQRKVEHEIRLKDGEVNLLGGMLEEEDIRSLSGIPGLAQIPLLKYLFSETSTEIKNNETVFALVPHIVRKTEFDELSERTLDVGTPNSLHLRHTSEAFLGAAGAAKVETAKSPGETVAALSFDPPAATAQAGTPFSVNVDLSGASDVSSITLRLCYDPAKLRVVNFSNGDFLAQGGQVVALVHRESLRAGDVEITTSRPPGTDGAFGRGTVATLTFVPTASGQSRVKIVGAHILQSSGGTAEVSAADLVVTQTK
jgi:general secretion pathway protein D